MSEEESNTIEEGPDTTQEPTQEPNNEPSVEDQARAMGWSPKEEWRGPDEKWVDAETFVERAENPAILKERFNNLEKQNRSTEKELKELKQTMREFVEHHKETSKREYERARKDLEDQMTQAVRDGDENRFKELKKAEDDLEAQRPVEQQQQDPTQDPQFISWKSDNTWYDTDPDMRAYADGIAGQVQAENPGLVGRAFFDAVAERVKKTFPQKFNNQSREQPAAVEGGGSPPARKSGKKGYSDLPPEAKEACDKFVKQGLISKEEYIKDFFGEQS